MSAPDEEPNPLQQAPGRGQYDRRQPREARLLEQRERLLSATALAALREDEPNIAQVVRLAGVSRNTFYEYFDDFQHARAAAAERAARRLVELIREAEGRTRTPVERWRALAQAWMRWVTVAPADASLCLASARGGLGVAGRELESALKRSLLTVRASGVRAENHDALRVTAAAAAGEVLARQIVSVRRSSDPASLEREREHVERALVDVAARLLR